MKVEVVSKDVGARKNHVRVRVAQAYFPTHLRTKHGGNVYELEDHVG
jgi:hypothetical protein